MKVFFGNNNKLNQENQYVFGNDNQHSGQGLVVGTNNIISQDSTATVFGDSVVIGPSVSNSFVIGSNTSVTQSDITLINTTGMVVNSGTISYSNNPYIFYNDTTGSGSYYVEYFNDSGSALQGTNTSLQLDTNNASVIYDDGQTPSKHSNIDVSKESISSTIIDNNTNDSITKQILSNSYTGITTANYAWFENLTAYNGVSSFNAMRELIFYVNLQVPASSAPQVLFSFDCAVVFQNSPGSYLFEMDISGTEDSIVNPSIYYNGKLIVSVWYDGTNAVRTNSSSTTNWYLNGSDDSYNIGGGFAGIVGTDVQLRSTVPNNSSVSLDLFDSVGTSPALATRWNCKCKVTHMTSI